MKNSVQLTKATNPISNSLNRPPWWRGSLLLPLIVTVASIAFSATGHAVCSEGCDGDNTFLGEEAGSLYGYQPGYNNTAIGYRALYSIYSGAQNTACGFGALTNNLEGSYNTATGHNALTVNSWGNNNTATGINALFNNNADYNTAHGANALISNYSGQSNTATGANSLYYNTEGWSNTAIGYSALHNTTGSINTALGSYAGSSLTTGSNNIALGSNAGSSLTTGSNNIDIGNAGVAGESGKIRIGTKPTHTATFIAGIRGTTVAGGIGVFIDANGRLGTATSSKQYKEAIHPMDKASEAILALEPVTFRYKDELDPEGIPQFGLVAEEVEKVNPDLVARDEHGKAYTVRYEAVNAMLLNEFLKEHRKGQEQDATIAQLKSALAEQQKEIKALSAGLKEQTKEIQKVSARVEAQQAAPRLASE